MIRPLLLHQQNTLASSGLATFAVVRGSFNFLTIHL